MVKVKPLYNFLNQNLVQLGVVRKNFTIDESMVPYYGRHSFKQFIEAKPLRFGYELLLIASATGLFYQVEIYEECIADL